MADPTSPTTNTPPIPSGSTAPTSLGSGSQTQRQGSSAGSAASSVDTTNPFRQGFPNPLRPLPQANFIVDAKDAESIGWWEPIQAAAMGYMKARGIAWNTVTLINRRNPRHEPSPNDLTILITAFHDAASDSWYLMLQDLQAYLQDRGLTHLRVEIMDDRFARMPDHFIVESAHPLVYAWPGICDRIIRALGPAPWFTLTAIRRGINKIPENNPITVLITSPDPPSLYPIVASIESICEDANFVLKVEILEESGLFAMDNPGEVTLDSSSFANPISMGSSVSSKSVQDSSGTIGGGIVLSKGKFRVRTGVTNFHVMRTKSFPQMYVDSGLRPEQSFDVNVQAVVPSNQDYRFNLGNQQSFLENAIERPLAIAREEQDEKRIQLFESRKQTHCQLINELQTFNRDAGNLWAASGFRIHPQNRFGIDWALIKLPEHRPTRNILPTDAEFLALGAAELTNELSIANMKLEEWSSENVKAGEVVFKRGRTTGLTIGQFNSINPRVHLDGKICSAWQVVGQRGKPFCRKGDSGSFVIDSVGRWCALIFASPYEDIGDAYVLPVDILVADIESTTGGTVSLP
ncbi:hypothetical protein GP486_001437 [Trichoglossum hirsutum]|uniref:Uncharacterized protein n=1 Tax=Trichoglossum hirsutum TaxID=265104 RepID=A0A9P8RT43_9PEZI|nr:hypothetical protein GP486_001437 [Trichoglossum hirsutum]